MSQAKFPFGKEFQIKILSLMFHDFNFLIFSQEVVQPSYFSDTVMGWFFTTMRDYFLDYQMRIDDVALRNEMKKAAASKRIKANEIQAYFQMYKRVGVPADGKDYVIKELITFCKHQAIKKASLEMPDLLTKNDFEAIEETWKQALLVGTGAQDIGIQYFVSWPERLGRRAVRLEELTIPTGITGLDICIGGGLRAGQLGLWMAPTNRGKSVALVHCGKRAVIMRKNVLHYTLELSAEDVAERYDASFSRIPIKHLLDMEGPLARKLEDLGHRMGNSLIIKEFPTKMASMNTIRSHIQQCMAAGFNPDLIIIDYLDLLKPTTRRKEKREELTDIAEEMRGLFGELHVPGWSATQARRAAISKETHDEEDVAEDIGKMNISDIVVTINQTKKEAAEGESEDESDPLATRSSPMRLLVAKNRNGPRWITVPIVTNLSRMCFFNPPKEEGKAKRAGKQIKKRPPPMRRPGQVRKTPPPTARPAVQ